MLSKVSGAVTAKCTTDRTHTYTRYTVPIPHLTAPGNNSDVTQGPSSHSPGTISSRRHVTSRRSPPPPAPSSPGQAAPLPHHWLPEASISALGAPPFSPWRRERAADDVSRENLKELECPRPAVRGGGVPSSALCSAMCAQIGWDGEGRGVLCYV